MASEHSYTITLNNNRTEKAAIDYLLAVDSRLWLPSKDSRKHILAALGLDPKFARAFDMVLVEGEVATESELRVADVDKITLVELKTTRKRLPDMPRGFFFGATQNEFDLAEALGERFRFCFVCLDPSTLGHRMLTLVELQQLIKTQRTQYQINL